MSAATTPQVIFHLLAFEEVNTVIQDPQKVQQQIIKIFH